MLARLLVLIIAVSFHSPQVQNHQFAIFQQRARGIATSEFTYLAETAATSVPDARFDILYLETDLYFAQPRTQNLLVSMLVVINCEQKSGSGRLRPNKQ